MARIKADLMPSGPLTADAQYHEFIQAFRPRVIPAALFNGQPYSMVDVRKLLADGVLTCYSNMEGPCFVALGGAG
jgi:hypothetical protein